MKIKIFFFAALLSLINIPSGRCGIPTEVEELINRAESGDTFAMYSLGSMYDTGQGVPRSGRKAMKWYRKAAEAGLAEAQNNVGSALLATRNYKEAYIWYEKASAQRHLIALNNLGYLHDMGLGVPQNRQRAFELYSQSAELGWAEAMWNLANMHGAGQVGPVDFYLACLWTRRAQRNAQDDARLSELTNQSFAYLKDVLSAEQKKQCEEDKWVPKGAP